MNIRKIGDLKRITSPGDVLLLDKLSRSKLIKLWNGSKSALGEDSSPMIYRQHHENPYKSKFKEDW